MALLPNISSADLLDLHDDLIQDYFPDTYWQKGNAGIITGTELPATFSSTEGTLQLRHWADPDAEILDNAVNQIPLLNSDRSFPLPVLNIAKRGFYRFVTMTDNQTGTFTAISPSYLSSYNRWMLLELDSIAITAGTGLD